MKNRCANIWTTRGKWVVNLLQSFDFMKVNIEKQLSSSTLPTICSMAIQPVSHILKSCKQKPKMLSPNATFQSKDWCKKVEPCMQLHSTSLLVWTCLAGYQGHWHWGPHAKVSTPSNNWHTPKFLDGFNYESKGEDNGRRRSWGMLLGLHHFEGRKAC